MNVRRALAEAVVLCALALPSAVFAQLPLSQIGGQSGGEFLPPEQAFVLSLARADGERFVARWRIADGYYLYRDKTALVANGEAVALDKPQGEMINDPYFGDIEIWRHQVAVHFETAARTAELTWQGCADAGLCYPPITRQVRFDDVAVAAAAVPGAPEAAAAAPRRSEQDRLADYLADARLGLAVLVFFGLGLLLAFTPCVWPMLPILSAVIAPPARERGATSRMPAKKAFALSSVYVLAMASTYSAAGVAVAVSGQNLQLWFQRPAVIVPFAAVFVLLALSMFGLYRLELPASLQTRLSGVGERRRGRYAGAAVMGVLSALVASPCVTAPLIGALLFVARTGDAATGGLALFSLALGMGAPLLAFGTSLARFMPKPGPFLNAVQTLLGFVLVGFAIWLLDRIILGHVTMLLAAMLLGAASVWLFGVLRGVTGVRAVVGGTLNALLMAYAVLLAANASIGGEHWLRPWHFEARYAAAHAHALAFERHRTIGDVNRAIASAADRGQHTMLVFYADWCVSCKELEAFTFSDAGVRRALDGVALLEADVTDATEQSTELLREFSLFGPPALLFFDRDAREVAWARLVGFIDADDFTEHLGRVFGLQQSIKPLDQLGLRQFAGLDETDDAVAVHEHAVGQTAAAVAESAAERHRVVVAD